MARRSTSIRYEQQPDTGPAMAPHGDVVAGTLTLRNPHLSPTPVGTRAPLASRELSQEAIPMVFLVFLKILPQLHATKRATIFSLNTERKQFRG